MWCAGLPRKAEALGVEIYPGFPGGRDPDGQRRHRDRRRNRRSWRRPRRQAQGTNSCAAWRCTANTRCLRKARAAHCRKSSFAMFDLDVDSEPQKFGIGLKELWQIQPEKHRPGLVQHTIGWPLGDRTGGGSFMYHYGENLVSIGFVVHLNYQNPYLHPFKEFQRFKTHPAIAPFLEGGKRIGYGARALTEGGWQSIPKLVFPGGALIGCSAGFMNVPRIKGSHNAMLSGKFAAEAVFEAIEAGRSGDELEAYERAVRTGPSRAISSACATRSRFCRGSAPRWERMLSGADMWLNTISTTLSPTLKHGKPDYAALKPAKNFKPIEYPKPDGKLTFDILSSLFLSGTNHEEDQPVHLQSSPTRNVPHPR